MSSTKIPFGLLGGHLKRAMDVPNGLACDCLCPGCRSPLIAANQGLRYVPHFRHATSVDCQGAYETALHRAAKELLLASMEVLTPEFRQYVTAGGNHLISGKSVSIPGALVSADQAKSEVVMQGVIPDVVYVIGGHQLLIEIHVAHKVDAHKQQVLRTLDQSSFEIDLRHLPIESVVDPKAFAFEVLHNPKNRHWLHSRLGARLVGKAVGELMAAREKGREEQRLREIEQAERRAQDKEFRELEVQAKREVFRQQVAQANALPQNKVYRENLNDLRQRVQDRADAIAGSIQHAVAEYGGIGDQCATCWMVNTPGVQSCTFCTGPTLDRVSFTPDYARTAVPRMRCSTKPDESLSRVPLLTMGEKHKIP